MFQDHHTSSIKLKLIRFIFSLFNFECFNHRKKAKHSKKNKHIYLNQLYSYHIKRVFERKNSIYLF
jgi:hypothetical protein